MAFLNKKTHRQKLAQFTEEMETNCGGLWNNPACKKTRDVEDYLKKTSRHIWLRGFEAGAFPTSAG